MAVFIVSGSSRTEEAAELYTKAGNTFKMAKKWAGKLYCTVYIEFWCLCGKLVIHHFTTCSIVLKWLDISPVSVSPGTFIVLEFCVLNVIDVVCSILSFSATFPGTEAHCGYLKCF